MLGWNVVDVLAGPRPNWIVWRHERDEQVLQLPLMVVVGHQPNTRARGPVEDRAASSQFERRFKQFKRRFKVCSPQSIGYGKPASSRVFVGVYHDSQRLSSCYSQIGPYRLEQRGDPVPLLNVELGCRRVTFA